VLWVGQGGAFKLTLIHVRDNREKQNAWVDMVKMPTFTLITTSEKMPACEKIQTSRLQM